MRSEGFVLTIDGPAGSGKSTTAKETAKALGFDYLDTGAMYRAITLKFIESGISLHDRKGIARVLRSARIAMNWRHGNLEVLLDGCDVTREIRTQRVSACVSPVSAIHVVRKRMVLEQRRIAQGKNLVCEGRDIGSVVFPNADLKVFLECDIEERTRRREKELYDNGLHPSRNRVRTNLIERDRIDSSRNVSPLRRVPDAVLIDTTMLTIREQVAVVCSLALAKLRKKDRA